MGVSWDGDDKRRDYRPGEGPAAGCLMAVVTLLVLVAVVAVASWAVLGHH